MNTQYDDIFECFLENCGYDRSEIPELDKRRYSMIRNSVNLYNQKAKKYEGRIQGDIICDDVTESLNKKLTSTELLILANILASVFCHGKLTEFTSIYGTFAKEMGFKFYNEQIQSRERDIQRFEDKATQLIEDEIDSFIL